MASSFIHLVVGVRISFLLKTELDIYTTFCFFVLLLIDIGWLLHLSYCDWFVTNIGIRISLSNSTFNSFGYLPWCRIAKTYANWIFNFRRGPLSPRVHQSLLFSFGIFVVLEFELGALCLLGRYSTTWAMLPVIFCFLVRSHILILPPMKLELQVCTIMPGFVLVFW
jgi:hypothetical protein